MMTALCIFSALVLAGFLTEITAAKSAPLGYQDEFGFHLGQPHPGPGQPTPFNFRSRH